MSKLLTGNDLERKARKLGIDIKGDLIFQSSVCREPRASDYELQRRVTEAERANRERWILVLALISVIVSAVALIITIVKR